MDFYLASDSSPAIHSKTIANPNKIVDDLFLKQASYTHD